MIIPNIWKNISHVPVTTNQMMIIQLNFESPEFSDRAGEPVTLWLVTLEIPAELELRKFKCELNSS